MKLHIFGEDGLRGGARSGGSSKRKKSRKVPSYGSGRKFEDRVTKREGVTTQREWAVVDALGLQRLFFYDQDR